MKNMGDDVKLKKIVLFFSLLLVIFSFILVSACNYHKQHLNLTKKELLWLTKNKKIKVSVAPAPNFPPLDIFSVNGKFTGFSMDYLRKISEISGINFKILRLPDWSNLMQKLENGNVTMVTSIQKTESREKIAYFTTPYVFLPVHLIVPKKCRVNNLKNFSKRELVGVVKGYSINKYIKLRYPDLKFKEFAGIEHGLNDLENGKIDAMVSNLATANFYIVKNKLKNIGLGQKIYYLWELRFAVSQKTKDAKIIISILQKSLDEISITERERIFYKWVALGGHFLSKENFWFYLKVFFYSVIILGFIALLWIVLLKKQVNKKTYQLHKELKQTVEAKKKWQLSEKRYRTIFNAVNDVIFIHDINTGKVIDASESAFEMYGYKPEEIINTTVAIGSSGIYPYTPEEAMKKMQLATDKPQIFKWHAKHKDGTLFWVEVNMKQLLFGDEKRIIVTVRNIEDRIKTEDRLLQAQKMEMIGTLAGGFAHDFNNLLAGIKGVISLLNLKFKKGTIDLDFVQDKINLLDSVTDRATVMVKQLQSLSKKHQIQSVPVDLNLVVKIVLEIFKSTMDRSIRLNVSLPTESAMILGDGNQLEQVLLNLCVNAEHAMTIMRENGKYEGELSISVERDGDNWLLLIKDTGVGIDSSTIENIFTPFFTTKPKGQGTGLGLAMAYNIINKHNGTIDVSSEKEVGSTFTIFLPAYLGNQRENKSNLSNVSNATVYKNIKNVLVVDDEELLRINYSEMLSVLNIESVVFETGKKAIEVYKEKKFDLVILDMVMPEMSGKDVFIELKKIDSKVSVVFASGYTEDKRIVQSLENGAMGFLKKPFSLDELSAFLKGIDDRLDSNG